MKKIAMMLLMAAFLVSFAVAQDKAAKTQKIAGWVADEKCAKMDKGGNASHADCSKKCMEAGEKLVLVSDKDKKVLQIDNQDAVKEHVGHYVAVTGHVENDSIHVDSVSMPKQPKAAQKGEHPGL